LTGGLFREITATSPWTLYSAVIGFFQRASKEDERMRGKGESEKGKEKRKKRKLSILLGETLSTKKRRHGKIERSFFFLILELHCDASAALCLS
jgi:hypothetical protein